MSKLHPYSQIFAHHPAVSPRVVIIRFDGGRLDVLDARNGITLWTTCIGHVKVRRRSKLESIGGSLVTDDMICAGSTDRGLYALDISTGETLWRYDARTPVVGTPYHANGIVYVLAWNGGHAVDIRTGEKCWHWRSEDLEWFGFPAHGCVYGAEAGKRVVALEAQSGEKIWEVSCYPNSWDPAFDGQGAIPLEKYSQYGAPMQNHPLLLHRATDHSVRKPDDDPGRSLGASNAEGMSPESRHSVSSFDKKVYCHLGLEEK